MKSVSPFNPVLLTTGRPPKKSVPPVTCALLFAALLLAPTTPAATEDKADTTGIAEVRQETREFLEALTTFSAQQRDEALKMSSEALNDLDSRINALESRIDREWDEMSRPVQQEARKNLRVLRQLRLSVAQYYGALEAGSADAWGEMKKGFANAYEDLYQASQRSTQTFEARKPDG